MPPEPLIKAFSINVSNLKKSRVKYEITLPAVVPGFEPGQTEPKPVVLPLHHTTIALCPIGTAKIRINPEQRDGKHPYLFCDEQIIVLFASLEYYVPAVYKICLSKDT